MNIVNLKKDLEQFKDEKFLSFQKKSFQIFQGGYGHGDKLLGVRNPVLKNTYRKYKNQINFNNINVLVQSPYHEIRYIALLWLKEKYKKNKEKVFTIYIDNFKYINNWDLIDISAPSILGDYIFTLSKLNFISTLFDSTSIWKKRAAIVLNLYLTRKYKREFKKDFYNEIQSFLNLLDYYINHYPPKIKYYELLDKAFGWVLRDIGLVDKNFLIKILEKYKNKMPKIMHSYATEKINKGG